MTVLRGIWAIGPVCAAVLCVASPASADPADPGDPYPVAQGNYTSADDPGWIFFLSPAGYGGARDGVPVSQFGCGIGPDGTVGCDVVPSPTQIGDAAMTVVPMGSTQTVAGPQQPGQYIRSAALTFTRNVDVLPAGYQLVNAGASCYVGQQGSVTCTSGDHGFTQNAVYGDTH